MSEKYVIGYWVSEKKRQKFNWAEFQRICESQGFLLKMVDVNIDLESQGPFHVFLHKLTNTQVHAENGDENAKAVITRIQDHFNLHPEIVVIDPLENIKKLRNRYTLYKIIEDEYVKCNDVFVPRFVELKSKNVVENMSLLKMAGIKFPFVCKPLIAHGSSNAHKMLVIFNEKGMEDCQPPAVAQNFINHNAIVYKLFVVGEYFHVLERPSLKNFYEEDCTMQSTIFFNTHDISKNGCRSKWSVLSEKDIPLTVKPKYEVLEKIVKRITKAFGLLLLGIDVVIENYTGKYGIIDVNVFPGYDKYPHFFEQLVDTIRKQLVEHIGTKQNVKGCTLRKSLTDDLDSGFESDDKKKYSSRINK